MLVQDAMFKFLKANLFTELEQVPHNHRSAVARVRLCHLAHGIL